MTKFRSSHTGASRWNYGQLESHPYEHAEQEIFICEPLSKTHSIVAFNTLLYNKIMLLHRPKPRKKTHLIIGLIIFTSLVGLVITFPPQGILLSIIFFILLFTSLFYLLSFVLNHPRRALLLSLGITFILILRALGLRHWLYLVLITSLVLSLNVYLRKKWKANDRFWEWYLQFLQIWQRAFIFLWSQPEIRWSWP